jgi:cytochrome c553
VQLPLLFVLILLAGVGLRPAAAAMTAEEALVAQGRAIYVEGLLPGGKPLTGTRYGTRVDGRPAACVICHRRSGMGSVEGDELVAPITGNALFMTGAQVVATMDPVRGKLMNQAHEPYTERSFALAMREGTHVSGRVMNQLMPRYKLADNELRALSAYLRTLSSQWSPGADAQALHLATVITPGVDEARRKAFLDTLQAAVGQKNGSTLPGKRHMVGAAEFAMRTERKWDLRIWELQGPASTWGAQLAEFYRADPVFAILSGLSEGDWAPVQDFCEQQGLPVWFPIVTAVPGNAAQGQYSLYFSRGVALEAAAAAEHFRQLDRAVRPARVVQVVGAGTAAAVGAAALEQALAASGIKVATRRVDEATPQALRQALSELSERDAIMLWLKPAEVNALGGLAPPPARPYFSATLAGAERIALDAAWKSAGRLVYPYELPHKRGANLAYFRTWINQRQIELVDEAMQSEAYFAVAYLSETVSEMLNNLYRDYLIERAENMLSRREGRKANEETHERQTIRSRYVSLLMSGQAGGVTGASAPGATGPQRAVVTPEDYLGRRTGTTIYPALGLGPGQRFASKGAYIVRFDVADGNALVAESSWLVP